MKSFARIIAFVVLFVCGFAAWTQQPPAPPPTPQVVTPKSPYTSDKAQLAVKQETILQLTANDEQKVFQDRMKDLQGQWQSEEAKVIAWIAEVKKVNGWDDTYTYDRAKDQWMHTPKPAPKVESKPAETPKK